MQHAIDLDFGLKVADGTYPAGHPLHYSAAIINRNFSDYFTSRGPEGYTAYVANVLEYRAEITEDFAVFAGTIPLNDLSTAFQKLPESYLPDKYGMSQDMQAFQNLSAEIH